MNLDQILCLNLLICLHALFPTRNPFAASQDQLHSRHGAREPENLVNFPNVSDLQKHLC